MFCKLFAWIRRLRKSPQYLLVTFTVENYDKIALSADLRNSPQNFHEQCAKRCKSPGSVNSLAQPKEMHTAVLGCRQMGSTLMGPLQKY